MATAVARILDDLRERGGLQGKDIANIVGASPPTVSRWSRGNGVPPLRTQTVIAELRYVVDRLSDVYTPDETRLWLHARHPLLNGQRAIDLINDGRTEEVLAVIERLDFELLHLSSSWRTGGPAISICWTKSMRCPGRPMKGSCGGSRARVAIRCRAILPPHGGIQARST